MKNDPASLLLVEDDETIRTMFCRYLQAKGFNPSGVPDGERALEALQVQPFDLLVLDTGLPGISGLEVLRRLRQSHSLTELPVVMATAQGQSADVVEALRLGANDYLTKPFDFAVALARLRTQLSLKRSVEEIARLEQSLSRRNAELEEANRRMRLDLEAAALVQRALLPERPPAVAGASFAWHFHPCAELAGDQLNVFALDERRVALYVLDVVGHGVKAALLAVMVSRVLGQLLAPAASVSAARAAQQRLPSPAEVAAHLDRLFPWDERTEQYFSLLYAVLDVATGTVAFASAGHPGPLHLPRSGQARSLDTPGSLIGLGAGQYKERSLALHVGDRLYFYTDGLPEAKNLEQVCFGKERLLAALAADQASPLQGSIEHLVQQVEQWCAPGRPHDDISILAVEWTKAPPAV